MRLFIYAYDDLYGGLHGMYDYTFYEANNERQAEQAEEVAIDLSCGVIERYYDITEHLEEEADLCSDDRDSDEWFNAYDEAVMQDTAYEIYALKDEVKDKNEDELDELISQEGVSGFIDKYCEEARWE